MLLCNLALAWLNTLKVEEAFMMCVCYLRDAFKNI